jgi:hypothetical protein
VNVSKAIHGLMVQGRVCVGGRARARRAKRRARALAKWRSSGVMGEARKPGRTGSLVCQGVLASMCLPVRDPNEAFLMMDRIRGLRGG